MLNGQCIKEKSGPAWKKNCSSVKENWWMNTNWLASYKGYLGKVFLNRWWTWAGSEWGESDSHEKMYGRALLVKNSKCKCPIIGMKITI